MCILSWPSVHLESFCKVILETTYYSYIKLRQIFSIHMQLYGTYVYMSKRMHMYTYVYIHVNPYTRMYTHVHSCTPIYTYVITTHVHPCTLKYTLVYIYVHLCKLMYTIHVICSKRINMKLFLWIFLNLVIYETFPFGIIYIYSTCIAIDNISLWHTVGLVHNKIVLVHTVNFLCSYGILLEKLFLSVMKWQLNNYSNYQ